MNNFIRKNTPILQLGIIFIAIIIVGTLLAKCDRSETITEIKYIHDTTLIEIETEVPVPYEIRVPDTIYLPHPVYIHDTVEIAQNIDTAAILATFFEIVEYKDIIADESLIFYLNESISQNRIIARETSYKWMKPTQIIEHKKYSTYIYAGLIYYSPTGLAPTLSYANRKLVGTIGYDPFNKSVFVGAGLKLFGW